MLEVKKCDRCKQFYEAYDGSYEFKLFHSANAVRLLNIDFVGNESRRATYNLCPACMAKLEDFLANGDKENG